MHRGNKKNHKRVDDEIWQIQQAVFAGVKNTVPNNQKSYKKLRSKVKRNIKNISKWSKKHSKKLIAGGIVAILLLQPVLFYFVNKNEQVQALAGQAYLYPDGDQTSAWWCNNTTPACGTDQAGTHYNLLDEDRTSSNATKDTDFTNTGTSMDGSGEVEEYTMQNPTISGTFIETTQVIVNFRGGLRGACQGSGGTPCDGVDVNIFINGSAQTAQNQLFTASTISDYTKTFNGNWPAINDLRVSFTRIANGGGSGSAKDDDVELSSVYADVSYTYNKAQPKLTQKGYIWEMDDASGDGAAQLAAGNTAITMRAGERATLRAQLRNTGGPLDIENLGLFYDRNDGMWSKVESFIGANTAAGSGCGSGGSTAWTCTTVDNDAADGTGAYTSLAFSSDGIPYISYWDATATALIVAQYVGSGGSGCGASGSSAWTCTTVDDDADDTGTHTSIAFSPSGVPYVSYYDATATSLMVAHYDGDGSASGCGASGSAAWTCTTVDDTGTSVGQYTSIAFSSTGVPYVSYYDITATALKVTYYDGDGSASGCTSVAWTCTTVDDTGTSVGQYTSIAFSPTGVPYVSYYDSIATALKVTYYDGDGSASGCTSAAWTCTTVDDSNLDNTGRDTSIAFSPDGTPYISYHDNTSDDIMIAQYVGGSSGSGCGASGSTAWTCSSINFGSSLTGSYSSLAFSPSGTPYISYYDLNATSLMVAYYDGDSTHSGCGTSGFGLATWTCITIDDDTDSTGTYSSLAFSPDGVPFISYRDTTATALKIAQVPRAGEIRISPSFGGASSLTESHADMTTTDDTGNRDDADCIDTGTWNNGKVFLAEEGSGLTLADGSGTAQCTEVAWTIDTSQAVPGTTYRFVIATDDAIAQSKGKWRGPIAIDNYPTLTIEDDSLYTTHQTASKDSLYTLPDCTDTDWGCGFLDQDTDSTGNYTSIAFSPNGTPYVSYYDTSATALMVAQYVGSGGSGCGASGSTAWTCTTVDNTGTNTGQYTSIAFSPTGTPYVSYYDATATALKVAYYDGDAVASGCTSDAWTCTTVDDDADNTGSYTSIAISSSTVYVAYTDLTTHALMVAQYVGSGGSGCGASGSAEWTCTVVDDDASFRGWYPSIAVNNDIPSIAYYNDDSGVLRYAQYVGSGGSGCGASGSAAWICTTVDNTGTYTAGNISLAFNPSGVPYISYYNVSATSLRVAYFDGDASASGCVPASWTCTTVDNDTDDTGRYSSIAFSPSGIPYVSYHDADIAALNLQVARYVGSGGSGCGASGSLEWTCTVVDSSGVTGFNSSISFGPAGNPFVSYYESTSNTALRIATYKGPLGAPTYETANTPSPRNGTTTYGRYPLSNGKPSATSSDQCTGAADLLGLCGIANEDSQYDSIVAPANHRPMYQMRARFTNNTITPTLTWVGTSSSAATSKTITLQVYRFGSTNAWETIATNTTCAASTACIISNMPSGTTSDYFETDGSNYWIYMRVYQAQETATSITFKTDLLKAVQTNQQLRHGQTFNRNLLTPFDTNR